MNEKSRFLLVGAYNTAFGYITFAVLHLALRDWVHYLVVAIISHAIAVINGFFAHRHFSFRDRSPVLPAFVRFNVSTAGVLGANLAGLWLLVEAAHFPPLAGQAIMTLAIVVLSYVIHRRFTFKPRRM